MIWHGCYDDSWKGYIVDEAFAHPAKYARGLIERIFDYLFRKGYLSGKRLPDVVVDPFGGIGTGGIIAASLGLQWIGCELEPKFHALAERNFALHRRVWEVSGDPLPIIHCGDSRRLRSVLGLADCVVSSPPFLATEGGCKGPKNGWNAHAASCTDIARETTATGRLEDRYGSSPGQLGSMPAGDVAAIVSSPPYEEGLGHGGTKPLPILIEKKLHSALANNGYGGGPGNISNLVGETFWTAARDIVSECYAILKPGGIAVWVVKGFVRNKQIVDFPHDWQRLCEACGFQMVEEIHASLVKEQRNADLFGGQHVQRTERKSFFRRLAEKKGSPRIDFETVLVMRKQP